LRGIEDSIDEDGSIVVSLSLVDRSISVSGISSNDEVEPGESISGNSQQSNGESRNVEVVSDGQSTFDVSSETVKVSERDDVVGIPVRCGGGSRGSSASSGIAGAMFLHSDVANSKVGSAGNSLILEGIRRALGSNSRAGLGDVAFSSSGSASDGRSQESASVGAASTTITIFSGFDDSVSTSA